MYFRMKPLVSVSPKWFLPEAQHSIRDSWDPINHMMLPQTVTDNNNSPPYMQSLKTVIM